MNVRRSIVGLGTILAVAFFALAFVSSARPAAAQGGAPDLGQFGYSTVLGAVNFTPGTAVTVSGGGQEVVLPADFISKTVKFELLSGDNSAWAAQLPADAQGRQVVASFAFRVTDSSGALVGRFDKPVVWSVTSPAVVAGADIYNTTAATPSVVTKNGTPPTLDGTKLAHSFGGAGVGWLAVNPAGAPVVAPAPAAPAPAGAADLGQFGYPHVLGAVNFTPGTEMTVSGGDQQVILPADFISKTVKFELLGGDASYWALHLPADDAGRLILAAFAFRVTDSNGTRIGRFDKPVIWSVTSPAAMAGAEIYNTTAADPPVVTDNPTPPTLDGTKLSHSFGGAGVGWLAVNPAGAVPVVIVPPPAPTPGMPVTGNGGGETTLLLGLLAALLLFSGMMLRRARATR